MMRAKTFLLGSAFLSVMVGASELPERVLLIPIDDRPATTQFAQMIGDMAGVQVEMPPKNVLGKFKQPGWPEAILNWMGQQDLSTYDSVIVSTDMIAYGGLIASRVDRSSYNLAINRLREFWRLRKTAPRTKFYGFSAVMRLAPTATNETQDWMMQMSQYAIIKDRFDHKPTVADSRRLKNLERIIPKGEVKRYWGVRERNHKVQQELTRMAAYGVFDYLIFGQDDAQERGPHIRETNRLKEMVSNLNINHKVYFAEGIDQHSNILVSRAFLNAADWSPRVRIVWADEEAKKNVALYETDSIEESLRDQLVVSGATPVGAGESFDYSLYVNTPEPKTYDLKLFLDSLRTEVDQGFPVAVADINLGKTGTGDPALYNVVTEDGRATRLLAYAGWNTAGNTMGTAIPAANVYLLSRKERVDPLVREVALRKFILHRLVNDFEYHSFVRPEAYAMVKTMPNATKAEAYGDDYDRLNQYVAGDIKERLIKRFSDQLLGTKFFAGGEQYEIVGLKNVEAYLPWPRAYEVKLEFEVEAVPVSSVPATERILILPLGDGSDGEKN